MVKRFKYNYTKQPQLIHYNYDMSRDWYVEVYLYDQVKEKLKRIRAKAGMNWIKDKQVRIKRAHELLAMAKKVIKEGRVIGRPEDKQLTYKEMTILEAIGIVLLKKMDTCRKTTLYQIEAFWKKMRLFLRSTNQTKLKIGQLDTSLIMKFLDYMQIEYKINNTTYNNYRGSLSLVINYFSKRDNTIFRYNPLIDVPKLEEETKRHSAYSQDEMKKLKQIMLEEGQHQLLLFISFIYYTLARPNEIEHMKIQHIELDEDRIYIPKETAKNKKGGYIDLFKPLKDLILEIKIMDYPQEYYIFSILGTPGSKPVYDKYFWKKHRKILVQSGLDQSDKNYDLYGYKHSGAINMYLSDIEMIDIQRQCRHKTLDQTMTYLRDLDCFRKRDHLDKVREF